MMKKLIEEFETKPSSIEKPYIIGNVNIEYRYNPQYGDNRICECGHPYYRHFDTYEDMISIGCKYCECYEFIEKMV